jgi:hypothetical protein
MNANSDRLKVISDENTDIHQLRWLRWERLIANKEKILTYHKEWKLCLTAVIVRHVLSLVTASAYPDT